MRTRRKLVPAALAALLTAGLVMALPRGAEAAVATVTVDKASAAPGASVTVRGAGFPVRRTGSVLVAGITAASVKTSRKGGFLVTVTVPSTAPAGATTVEGRIGTTSATAAFTVLSPPSPAPAPAPATSALRPVGAAVMTDADAAARVRRSPWEPRPQNGDENGVVPTSAQLSTFYGYTGQWGSCENLRQKVTGKFTGTTDEIIQWAAWKWGLPEDVVRAVAVTESWWDMDTVGDNGQSFGLMQVKNVAKWHGGTYPMSRDATAFNVDYWAGMVRHYFEGCAGWMKDYAFNGTTYGPGDLWGSVGAWYAGNWHSDAANWYIAEVKKHLADRTWSTPGF